MSEQPIEPPAVRIRRAELAQANLRLEYWEWFGRYAATFQGTVQEKDIRDTVMRYGLAKQDVIIAEARLDQAISEIPP